MRERDGASPHKFDRRRVVYGLRIASRSCQIRGGRRAALWTAVACILIVSLTAAAEAGLELWPSGSSSGLGSLLPTTGRTSLLDPSKLDISQQMVFSYSSASAGKDNVGGLWLTNFSYKISNPLTVDLSVGASLSNTGARELSAQGLFLESFSLRYRPNENFYFHFMYREAPNPWFLRPDGFARW